MKTQAHIHEEVFSSSPEEVFALLHTPSAIRKWWSAAQAIVVPEVGGIWCATWGGSEDEPDYVGSATIEVFDPPRRLVLTEYEYFARSGPLPFEADFKVEFLVEPHPDGSSLKVVQDGFPISEEGNSFLEACVTGWTNTFAGIRSYLELV